MTRSIALGLVACALLAAPVAAAPACSGSFTLSPERYSEADINEFHRDILRSMGIDVTRAEIWSGCIRAWVRTPNGEEMQFFEPLNFRRVE